MAVSMTWAVLFCGGPEVRASLFGVCIRAPDFAKLPDRLQDSEVQSRHSVLQVIAGSVANWFTGARIQLVKQQLYKHHAYGSMVLSRLSEAELLLASLMLLKIFGMFVVAIFMKSLPSPPSVWLSWRC